MTTYTRTELQSALQGGICVISFEKLDGDTRVMECTLQNRLLNEAKMPVKTTDRVKKVNLDVLSVWDVNKEGWRSFRVDKVFDMEPTWAIEE
jgi:hypothetical protein